MTMMRSVLLVALVGTAVSTRLLRNGTAPSNEAKTVAATSAAVKPADEKEQVVELRSKLQKMAEGLNFVTQKNGTLAHTAVAEEIKEFLTQFRQTLKDSETEKNSTKALKQLQDAQVSVHGLVKDMSPQQMRLMKENEDQEMSLLLGVLMTKQKEPMDKQMEVMTSKEFKNLKVVSAVLAAKDNKTALFKQVAEYCDKHGDKVTAKVGADKNGKPDVSPIVLSLQHRVDALVKSNAISEKMHKDECAKLDMAIANESKDKKEVRLVKILKARKKKQEHQFAKTSAIRNQDINTMKAAVDAIKKGDMKALGKAQAALSASLKAMKTQTQGFLYLIQLAHKSEGRDCPFCVAQCVDKCHSAGKPYIACMTECANAGQ